MRRDGRIVRGGITVDGFSFNIVEEIAVLSCRAPYSTELNVVSFDDAYPKYDIRRWRTEDGVKHPAKGCQLGRAEMRVLRDALNKMVL